MQSELTLYGSFIKEIKDLIYRRQYEAMKQVNAELIQLYWEIGGEIDRQQREQGWGKSVVEVLSKELQKEFPGVQGFSARNLWLMRGFYAEYSSLVERLQKANLQPLVADLEKRPQKANLPPIRPTLTKPYPKSTGCKRNLPSRTITILTLSKWVSNTARRNLKRVL